ncbi:MAG: hypothetical protein CL883_05540 [Dehalococcoidia bacterium]|nr:hypothetical protein [Dehalococcoidia bacterium]|tara:strand:+ start:613 stop:810 length:198 start_codon:yes stop_codon:yes gene_type:complete
MTNKEEEFEFHVEGLKEYIYEGVFGTDPLCEGLGNDWGEILHEAMSRAISQYSKAFDNYKEDFEY